MGMHTQIRSKVDDDAIEQVEQVEQAALRTYATFIADYTDERGAEWTWTTYRRIDDPTRFCSVIWDADEASAERHEQLPATAEFTRVLYKHVTGDAEQHRFEVVADSTRTHETSDSTTMGEPT